MLFYMLITFSDDINPKPRLMNLVSRWDQLNSVNNITPIEKDHKRLVQLPKGLVQMFEIVAKLMDLIYLTLLMMRVG